jgi:predicted XRE-type DNA-binding protein
MNPKATKTNARALDGLDVRVRPSSGNVFPDLGLSDADERLTKAELANEICSVIKSAKLTQTQAARRLGVDQPKVAALMRGLMPRFACWSKSKEYWLTPRRFGSAGLEM